MDHVELHPLSSPESDVDESPARFDCFKSKIDRRLNTRSIEANIDAFAVCKLFDLLDDVFVFRIDRIVRSEIFGKLPAF